MGLVDNTQPHARKNRSTLMVATLGMRLEPYHSFLLAPFSAWPATTLGHASARLPLSAEEPYNPDGRHVRCFRCGRLLAFLFGVRAAAMVEAALLRMSCLPGLVRLNKKRSTPQPKTRNHQNRSFPGAWPSAA
jgi:hypothetical protein